MAFYDNISYSASPAEYNLVSTGSYVYPTLAASASQQASLEYGSAYGYAHNPSSSPVVSSAQAAYHSSLGLSDDELAYFSTWGQGDGQVANPAASSNLDPYPYAYVSSLYNTDAETAYQEALSNTAIQRQMDDFKRAGLNPMLAARYGGADGVGLVGNVAGVGAGYANTSGATAGGGSGYSSPGSTSGQGGSAHGLSDVIHYAAHNHNVQSSIAAIASAATYGLTHSFQGAAAVYYGVQGAFGILSHFRK